MFCPSKLIRISTQRVFYQLCKHSSICSRIPLNYEFLTNPDNTDIIEKAIFEKACIADLNKLKKLYSSLKTKDLTETEENDLHSKLEQCALEIPNIYDPNLLYNVPQVLETVNEKPVFKFKTKDYTHLLKSLRMIFEDQVFAWFTGRNTYCLYGDAALFEKALLSYTLRKLAKKGFTLLSVPDILYGRYIEKAGMPINATRSQVYHLVNDTDLCLSGTSEHAICGYLADKIFDVKELPLKFMALSRCYREEASQNIKEKGYYRVNQFTKIEMFGVTSDETGTESQTLYNELIETQKELFSALGLHFQILKIPPNDLGASAYCKTDIEAWMPFRQYYGEISSTSNCTDYQSRRLNIRYRDANGDLKFVHTVNGTGCAIPRMMMSLFLTYQEEFRIRIPEVLRPFMENKEALLVNKRPFSFRMSRE